MRILVTGGAGFVGSHIVDALTASGHDVSALDCLDPAAHAGPPDGLNPAAEYRWDDVADTDAALAAVAGADAVCHQAAKVGLGLDFADVRAYCEQNDLGTATLLWALHASGFRGRLVLASSMVVYGEGRYRCAAHGIVAPGPRRVSDLDAGRYEPPCPTCGAPLEPEPVPEDAPLDPRNVYAATKLHQEHLCAAFARETGVAVTALRYHNVYGPRMPRDTPYAGVASIFRSALEAGEAPRVLEDGRQLRDFVHVRDVAEANVLALTSPEPVPGALNVCSGTPTSVGAMAAALSDAAGDGAPRPEVVGGYRLGDVRHVFASPDRAAARLGFQAKVPFVEGVAEFSRAPLRRPPPDTQGANVVQRSSRGQRVDD
ncbi:MAG: NAD-dependent epimerase/dehydratase family protein [Egibacteraceae bacterium]|jgi:dTDP-L-rhamnose 4-epimerase